ncbi:hypothetical protein L1987_23548 [Smallanthus sonchifolius]|uniref:Uncharacterized protein n=1 Tax=Smallanthus sonchifolius TaxID=185202 RepID=A0ACB9III4_9ASTR|nr:hypothetical protein L1987_23548 [Smallanthus sonchifolius]
MPCATTSIRPPHFSRSVTPYLVAVIIIISRLTPPAVAVSHHHRRPLGLLESVVPLLVTGDVEFENPSRQNSSSSLV